MTTSADDHGEESAAEVHVFTDEQLRTISNVRIHPSMAMMVSTAERDHIDMLRARSLRLAEQRGHMRR